MPLQTKASLRTDPSWPSSVLRHAQSPSAHTRSVPSADADATTCAPRRGGGESGDGAHDSQSRWRRRGERAAAAVGKGAHGLSASRLSAKSCYASFVKCIRGSSPPAPSNPRQKGKADLGRAGPRHLVDGGELDAPDPALVPLAHAPRLPCGGGGRRRPRSAGAAGTVAPRRSRTPRTRTGGGMKKGGGRRGQADCASRERTGRERERGPAGAHPWRGPRGGRSGRRSRWRRARRWATPRRC